MNKTEILAKHRLQTERRRADQTPYQKLLKKQKLKTSVSLYDKLLVKGMRHEIIDYKNELTKISKIIKKLENEKVPFN